MTSVLYSIVLVGLFLLTSGTTKIYGQTDKVIYSTNFGSASGAVSTISGWTASGAQSANVSLSAGSTSSGYSSPIVASGSANLADAGTVIGTSIATLSGQVNTVGLTDIKVIYGARRTSTYTGAVTLEWSNDGSTWNPISYTDVANNGNWALINSGTPLSLALPTGAEGQANLRF